MEPGIYYIKELKPEFALADRAAKLAEKEKPKLLKAARVKLHAVVRKEFRLKDAKLCHEYNESLHFKTAAGVELHLDLSEMKGDSPASKAYAAVLKVAENSSDLCAHRCALHDMMETGAINNFKSYTRSVYGAKPTLDNLAQSFRDFRAQRIPHSCPIKRKRG